jgi:hypothetical protein
MKDKLVDYAEGKGVYQGDLKYGRTIEGERVKGKDSPSHKVDGVEQNPPVVALKLIQPRDPYVWTRDTRLKGVKNPQTNLQKIMRDLTPGVTTDEVVSIFKKNVKNLRANISLKVGKDRVFVV